MMNIRELLDNSNNPNSLIYINNIVINNNIPNISDNLPNISDNSQTSQYRTYSNIPTPSTTNNNNNTTNNNNNTTNNNTTTTNNTTSTNNSGQLPNLGIIEIEPLVASATINFNDFQSNTIENISNSISEEINNLYNSITLDGINTGRRIIMQRDINFQNRNESVPLSQLNSKSQLISIRSNNIDNYNENCSICSSPIIEDNIIRKINECNHYFHQECVDRWFSNNSTCPICRINLNTNLYGNNSENSSERQFIRRNNNTNSNNTSDNRENNIRSSSSNDLDLNILEDESDND